MMGKCPRCKQVYASNELNTDYVHNCDSGNSKRDNEDVLKIGNYIDEVTGQEVAVNNVNFQGASNTSENKVPHKKGPPAKKTSQGNNTELYRERKHSEYIEF